MARAALALLVLAALYGTPAQAEETERPPRGTHLDLVLDRMEHDFGTAAQHERLEATFTIRNRSEQTVEGIDVGADCGCNKVKLSTTSLEPGATAELIVGFDTGTLSGRLTKRVRVWSADRKRGRIVLRVSIAVVAGLIVEPGALAFKEVAFGSRPSAHFDVKWYDGVGTPFDLEGIEIPGEDFDVSIEAYEPAKDDDWRGHRVHVTFRTPPPLGIYSAEVLVKTSLESRKRITVPLTANVVGRVWLQTRTIHFGVVPEGTSRTASIKLRPRDDGDQLGAVSATSRSGALEVAVTRDAHDERYWVLKVTVPDSTKPGRLDDEVVELRTEVPGEERIEVQVRGRVRPRRSS